MPEKTVVTLALRGPIHRGGVADICASADSLLRSGGARTLECDVSAIGDDAVAIEALASLRLLAHRRRVRLRLWGVSRGLGQLIDLCGLAEALISAPDG